jgi:hypothetical protein
VSLKAVFLKNVPFFNWQKSTLKVMQKNVLRLFGKNNYWLFLKKLGKFLSFMKKGCCFFASFKQFTKNFKSSMVLSLSNSGYPSSITRQK